MPSRESLEIKCFQKCLVFLSNQFSDQGLISAPNVHATPPIHKLPAKRLNKEFKRFKSATKMIADAYLNPGIPYCYLFVLQIFSRLILSPVYLPFDAIQFHLKKDKSLFPNPNLGLFNVPTTVVDCVGRIVLWYLPGLLPDHIQVCILQTMAKVL